jgi:hypothetical protein
MWSDPQSEASDPGDEIAEKTSSAKASDYPLPLILVQSWGSLLAPRLGLPWPPGKNLTISSSWGKE